MAAFAAMLTACAGSPGVKPVPRAPDPVVERELVTVRVCPPEVVAPIAGKPAPPAGAVIEGDSLGLGWIAALGRWGEALAGRLTDAAKQCS